ncbi:hypothetical protein quinque_015968 [Culex quinquefasciatus]
MALWQRIFDKVIAVFKKHGAETIDTPVFELKEVLTGKYGEDSKLIYDLKDQGGEILALRYDLTVPFARGSLAWGMWFNIRRYHIAKGDVRSDAAGRRVRQGSWRRSWPELDIGEFVVKLNHRKLLDGMFEGVRRPRGQAPRSAPPLTSWTETPRDEVRKEMIDEKGLDGAIADKIGEFVRLSGGVDLVDKLAADENLKNIKSAVEGIEDMRLLLQYCAVFGLQDKIIFDLSLAPWPRLLHRVIYEAVLKSEPAPAAPAPKTNGTKSKARPSRRRRSAWAPWPAAAATTTWSACSTPKRKQVPCVGVSIGVRAHLLDPRGEGAAGEDPHHRDQVYVASAHQGAAPEADGAAGQKLWDAGFKVAEHSYKSGTTKLLASCSTARRTRIPYAIVLRGWGVGAGVVKLREDYQPQGGGDRRMGWFEDCGSG